MTLSLGICSIMCLRVNLPFPLQRKSSTVPIRSNTNNIKTRKKRILRARRFKLEATKAEKLGTRAPRPAIENAKVAKKERKHENNGDDGTNKNARSETHTDLEKRTHTEKHDNENIHMYERINVVGQ